MANYETPTTNYSEPTDTSEPADMTFEQMYGAYYERLVNFVKHKFPNLPEAEHAEVIQDSMIKAMIHYDDYQDINSSRKAWIYQIVRRTALDRLRANKIRIAEPSSDMAQFIEYPDKNANADFETIYSNNTVQRALDHVASVLTEENIQSGWLELFKLHILEDKAPEEIADTLSIKTPTVKTRIHRIRKRLADDAALREILGS